MTLDKLRTLFPNATTETWHCHTNGGGWVQNTARVDATAYVGMDCIVIGNAQVTGNAWEFSPLQIMGTKHFVVVGAYGLLSIGYEKHDIEWWKQHYRAVGRREGYTKSQIQEYRNYIELARVWMKIHGVDKVTEK